jgi:hypothetical protein
MGFVENKDDLPESDLAGVSIDFSSRLGTEAGEFGEDLSFRTVARMAELLRSDKDLLEKILAG